MHTYVLSYCNVCFVCTHAYQLARDLPGTLVFFDKFCPDLHTTQGGTGSTGTDGTDRNSKTTTTSAATSTTATTAAGISNSDIGGFGIGEVVAGRSVTVDISDKVGQLRCGGDGGAENNCSRSGALMPLIPPLMTACCEWCRVKLQVPAVWVLSDDFGDGCCESHGELGQIVFAG